MPIPAVIYARYSSSRQREESIEDQLKVCNDFAKRNGYKVIGEYCDYAISGTTDDRPQFQKMLRDSENRKFQLVIVYKLDRFARDRYDSAVHKRRLRNNGVKLVSAMESIPDTPEGIILESLMEGMAEYYSANLSQNIKRGMYSNAEKCKANGVHIFGYRVGADGRYEIDHQTALFVQEIFRQYLNGATMNSIASWLNRSGVKTITKSDWTPQKIHTLLKNDKYTGLYHFGNIIVPGGMPAIISQATFYAASDVKLRKKAHSIDHLLAGKVFCSCGKQMIGTAGTSRNGDVHRYYACADRLKHKCDSERIPSRKLEKIALRGTKDLLCDPVAFESILETLTKLSDDCADIDMLRGLERRKRQVDRKLGNIIETIAEEGSNPLLIDKMNKLQNESREIALTIEAEKVKSTFIPIDFFEFLLEKVRDLDENDDSKIRGFFANFVSRVEVSKAHITIVFPYNNEHGNRYMQNYTCSQKYAVVEHTIKCANHNVIISPCSFSILIPRAA